MYCIFWFQNVCCFRKIIGIFLKKIWDFVTNSSLNQNSFETMYLLKKTLTKTSQLSCQTVLNVFKRFLKQILIRRYCLMKKNSVTFLCKNLQNPNLPAFYLKQLKNKFSLTFSSKYK